MLPAYRPSTPPWFPLAPCLNPPPPPPPTGRVFIGLPNRAARTAILRIILADERLAGEAAAGAVATFSIACFVGRPTQAAGVLAGVKLAGLVH